MEKTLSDEVLIPENDPPTFTSVEVHEPNVEEDLSDEIMFEDDNTSVGVVLIPTAFNLLQKSSSSKPHYDFGLSSSSEELEEENIEGNKHLSPPPEDTLKDD